MDEIICVHAVEGDPHRLSLERLDQSHRLRLFDRIRDRPFKINRRGSLNRSPIGDRIINRVLNRKSPIKIQPSFHGFFESGNWVALSFNPRSSGPKDALFDSTEQRFNQVVDVLDLLITCRRAGRNEKHQFSTCQLAKGLRPQNVQGGNKDRLSSLLRLTEDQSVLGIVATTNPSLLAHRV